MSLMYIKERENFALTVNQNRFSEVFVGNTFLLLLFFSLDARFLFQTFHSWNGFVSLHVLVADNNFRKLVWFWFTHNCAHRHSFYASDLLQRQGQRRSWDFRRSWLSAWVHLHFGSLYSRSLDLSNFRLLKSLLEILIELYLSHSLNVALNLPQWHADWIV